MKLIFLGTGDFAVPALRALHAAGHEVATVISQPDRPAGRGRGLLPTPVRVAAEALGLRHVQADDVNALPPGDIAAGAELGIVAAFGQKLGPRLLVSLPHGFINIHGSLLPKYRGAAPYQHAILAGDDVTGVTIFQINERWDAGSIWSTAQTPIGETETADELHDRLARIGAELIVETLREFQAGRIQPAPQDVAAATRAPKLTKADGYVDWSWPARHCVRRIHGLWSWPAVTCRFVSQGGREEPVQLARATPAPARAAPATAPSPGVFCDDLSIQAGDGAVRLLEVKPAGGKLMPFDAYANGRRIRPGDRLLRVEP